MKKFVCSFFAGAMVIVLTGAWTPTANIQGKMAAMGKDFASSALAVIRKESGSNAEAASRWYMELSLNSALGAAGSGTYYQLDAHAGFGAQIADYIYRGGANTKRTQDTVAKCAVFYGEALAQVFNGEKVAAVSQEFMLDFTDCLDKLRLNPYEYDLAQSCARYQFSTLAKIQKKAGGKK